MRPPPLEEEHEEHATTSDDDMDLDVESPQRPGDISNSKSIVQSMHDVHAEIGLGQGPNPHLCRASCL